MSSASYTKFKAEGFQLLYCSMLHCLFHVLLLEVI